MGAEIKTESILDSEESAGDIEATAMYDLVHPYEGKNFEDALIHGEEVTARVRFYVELGGSETEVYNGHVTYEAGDIFNPASVVGMEEQNQDFQSGQPVPSEETVVEMDEGDSQSVFAVND